MTAPPSSTSMGSWVTSLAGAVTYAQDRLTTMFEGLDVVEPTGEESQKDGLKTDVLTEERKAAWGTIDFKQYIGMDVTSLLSVPVWIMEPMTVLQKMAEIMEYRQLLDAADATDDEWERFALVAAFLVSPYGCAGRTWKPFNPLLGETFELALGESGTFFAEQVSHHPPIAAAHAECAAWTYDIVSAPTTRFLGNSLEVFPNGRTRISLSRSGELFTHVPPHAKVHNIVLGGTWVDAFGEFYVHCPTSGATCRLNFEAAGWFSSGRFQFSGTIEDAEGNAHMLLSGEWNSHCDVQPCGADGEPVPDSEPRRLWSCAPKPEGDKYCFTHFAHGLNGVDGLREAPLASDSRRRADRAALALGDSVAAQQAKHELEEAQRAERRRREAAGDVWTPRYFAPVESLELLPGELGTDVVPAWQWNGAWKGQAAGSTSQPPQPEDVLSKGFHPFQYSDSA